MRDKFTCLFTSGVFCFVYVRDMARKSSDQRLRFEITFITLQSGAYGVLSLVLLFLPFRQTANEVIYVLWFVTRPVVVKYCSVPLFVCCLCLGVHPNKKFQGSVVAVCRNPSSFGSLGEE